MDNTLKGTNIQFNKNAKIKNNKNKFRLFLGPPSYMDIRTHHFILMSTYLDISSLKVNINYLEDNKMKQQLNYILQSFNLSSVVYFPTRTCTSTQTLIDNIFIDITKFENYLILPVFNGLSDHDGQLLFVQQKRPVGKGQTQISKLFEHSLDDFKLSLSFENWETVFNAEDNNIDSVFNNFVDVYLQIFNACFPQKKIYKQSSSKQWLTTGIKTSCRRKRELYLLVKFMTIKI